jgi:transcriptional regulator NrdR family protein
MSEPVRCPRCGCGMSDVVDRRERPGGSVRVRRVCRHCGRVFYTRE